MPSSLPLPSVPDLTRAFHAAVGSQHKTEDSHDGSVYDRFAGLGALTMRRLAERDQGEARAIFFDNATDERLDYYISKRFGVERVQDTPGTGFAQVKRASGTAGTFLKGTRIGVGRGGSDPLRYWLVAADTPIGTDLQANVPIVAGVTGPLGQLSVSAEDVPVLQFVDQQWDNTWQVLSIDCGPGTTRQSDAAVRAGIRQQRLDSRPGFETAIVNAMVAAGAGVVALYQSDFLGEESDCGLNRIYVGDAAYESPLALLSACRLAVPNVCVAGTSVQVLPMTNSLLYVKVNVKLWDSPERFNQVQAQADAIAATTEYFAKRDNAFLWSAGAIRAAVMGAVPNVHSVTVSASTDSTGLVPVPEPVLANLFSAYPLPRYRVADWSVTATVSGPS